MNTNPRRLSAGHGRLQLLFFFSLEADQQAENQGASIPCLSTSKTSNTQRYSTFNSKAEDAENSM